MADETNINPPGGGSGEIQPVHGQQLRTYLEGFTQNLQEVKLLEFLIKSRNLRLEDAQSFHLQAKQAGVGLIEHARTTGLASEEEIVRVFAAMYGYEPVSLPQTHVEEDIATMITGDQARELSALPYGRADDGSLLVAISDPTRPELKQKLTALLPQERHLTFMLASETALLDEIERVYPRAEEIAEAIRNADAETVEDINLAEEQAGRDDANIAIFKRLVESAISQGASDIHIMPVDGGRARVRFRLDGVLEDVVRGGLPMKQADQITGHVKHRAEMNATRSFAPQDGSFSYRISDRSIDIRVSALPTAFGHDQMTMRILDPAKGALSLDKLGMSEIALARFLQAIQAPYGLALVTGPTGSGKTTTLHAALRLIATPDRNVIAIEDPVEVKIPGVVPVQIPALGEKKMSFGEALRGILRADPDVILVGEIRDSETAETVIEASQTGHYVYSTLHTNDAVGSIVRMQHLGIDPYQLAEALEIVIAQRLVRVLCTHCRVQTEATPDILRESNAPEWAIDAVEGGAETMLIYSANPEGCAHCGKRGYRGRTGIHEVLLMSAEMKQLIADNGHPTEVERLAREQKMLSLRDDAFMKVREGVTTLQEMERMTKTSMRLGKESGDK